MSTWTWDSLQTLWKFAGGNASRAQVMAAIALAESGGRSWVVSSAGAIGLWQEEPFWAGHFGWPVSYLYQPLYNAKAAVGISGGGFHLGAWDTCYYPTSSAANRRDLHWPMQHSDAWNILQTHGAASGPGGGGETVGGPDPSDRQLIQQTAWANHLQNNAIPNNTAWVAYNRKLHYRGRTQL